MPIYEFKCPQECQEERYLRVKDYHERQWCLKHWELMAHVITAPLMVKVAADVAYDSPIDGKIINSWTARKEDLKRSGCRPYDEGMKQDYHRHIKESESALDKAVDASVEEAVEHMPTATRGKLFSELVDQGVTADTVRK